jgi:hypothetical protein
MAYLFMFDIKRTVEKFMDSVIQVWKCDTCGHERQYGATPKPTEAHLHAWLYCTTCNGTVAHTFNRIQPLEYAKHDGVETDTKIPRSRRI